MRVLFQGTVAATSIIAAAVFGGDAVAAATSSGNQATPTDNNSVTQLRKHSNLNQVARPKVTISQAVKRTFIEDHEHDD